MGGNNGLHAPRKAIIQRFYVVHRHSCELRLETSPQLFAAREHGTLKAPQHPGPNMFNGVQVRAHGWPHPAIVTPHPLEVQPRRCTCSPMRRSPILLKPPARLTAGNQAKNEASSQVRGIPHRGRMNALADSRMPRYAAAFTRGGHLLKQMLPSALMAHQTITPSDFWTAGMVYFATYRPSRTSFQHLC